MPVLTVMTEVSSLLKIGDSGDSKVTVPRLCCHHHKPSNINGLSVVGDSSDSILNSRAGEKKDSLYTYAYVSNYYYRIYGIEYSVTSVTNKVQSLMDTGFSEVTVVKNHVTSTVTTVTKNKAVGYSHLYSFSNRTAAWGFVHTNANSNGVIAPPGKVR